MVNKMAVKIKGWLVYGAGTNDSDYDLSHRVDGKVIICQFYRRWCSMLQRCYDKKFHKHRPTYSGCIVCEEWLTFSNFKKWMEKQDWEGKQLDKDLLVFGNKVYSPDTCVFIDLAMNTFISGCDTSSGGYYWHAKNKKFVARCNNPLTKITENLGNFYCSEDAHQAWKKRKHELACQLAELQTDERVASALRNRYL